MNSEIKTAIILVSVIAVGIGVMSVVLSSFDEETSISNVLTNENSISKIDKSGFKKAPDLVGIASLSKHNSRKFRRANERQSDTV